jgi:DNA-directed RNA polymerase specialized sigma24 family protein
MYSGYIFVLAARRGHHLTPSDTELEQLRCDSALRDELATMIIAKALRFFRERVLIANTWLEDGGASVTTYFAGCCVFEFPNEFRLHRRTQKRWREQDLWETRTTSTTTAWADDPADVIGGKLWADSRLARLDPRPRAIVILRMTGYSYLEIAELLGETSVRAIEGVLYRLRTAERSWPTGEDER